MRSTTSRGRSTRSTSPPGGDRFDVIHDHCGFTALAMADRIDTPIVHTLHGQFTAETRAAFYARHGHKATLVGHQPRAARVGAARAGSDRLDPQPDRRAAWPLQERKDDYLLWIGRMTPGEGPASRDRRGARRRTCRWCWPA